MRRIFFFCVGGVGSDLEQKAWLSPISTAGAQKGKQKPSGSCTWLQLGLKGMAMCVSVGSLLQPDYQWSAVHVCASDEPSTTTHNIAQPKNRKLSFCMGTNTQHNIKTNEMSHGLPKNSRKVNWELFFFFAVDSIAERANSNKTSQEEKKVLCLFIFCVQLP